METPRTLQEAIQYFTDFENCRQFMVAMRWPDGKVRCPNCQSENVSYLQKARVYKCYGDHPKPKFSLKVGTVFEDSPIALEKWLPAVWMLVNDKNGISSYEIHRALGVTQKSAWFMLHRIRLALKDGFNGKIGSGDGGEVEVDETFVGGQMRFMHRRRKEAIQRRANDKARWKNTDRYPGKTAVLGLLDREQRKVRAAVVPNVKRETLQAAILSQVEHGSRLYSDQAIPYTGLTEKYTHEVVTHITEYVRGNVHTNGLENFWSLMKRSLKGTYVAVEPFHLDRYIDEQAFRYNNRATKDNPLTDSDRFGLAVRQIVGKRLTYAELTGKTAERPL